MKNPLRVLLIGLSLGALTAGMAWGAARSWLQHHIDRHAALEAQAEANHHARFVAERAAVAAMPFWAGIGGARDAGAFFNDRLSWRLTAPGTSTAALSLPPTLVAALQEESAAADAVVVTALTALDLSWFDTLHTFDHWRLDRAILARRAPDDRLWDPMPDLITLRLWARLRLRLALLHDDRDQELGRASRDVQQLARLLASTETLIGTMVATAILLDERAFADADPARAPFMAAFSRDDVDRLRRVARAGFSSVSPDRPADVLDGTGALDCVALHENLVGHWASAAAAAALGLRGAEPEAETLEPHRAAARAHCRFVDATNPDVVRGIVLGPDGALDPWRLWACDAAPRARLCRVARLAFPLPGDGDRALRAIDALSDVFVTGLRAYDEAPAVVGTP